MHLHVHTLVSIMLATVRSGGAPSQVAPAPPWQPPTGFPTNPCPCGVLCKPLTRSRLAQRRRRRLQFFGFHATSIYNGSSDDWQHWDFESLSTIAVWSIWQLPAYNWSMLCKAHEHGVRVVVPFRGGDYHSSQIMNGTARKEWIDGQVAEVLALGQ